MNVSKPSDRIYELLDEAIEYEKKSGQTGRYAPGYVDKLIPAIIQYLDEQAAKT